LISSPQAAAITRASVATGSLPAGAAQNGISLMVVLDIAEADLAA
jgi:hypothetical protein